MNMRKTRRTFHLLFLSLLTLEGIAVVASYFFMDNCFQASVCSPYSVFDPLGIFALSDMTRWEPGICPAPCTVPLPTFYVLVDAFILTTAGYCLSAWFLNSTKGER